MALDLYVGPVSRYIAGDWKNVAQQNAEASGIAYTLIGPGVRKPKGFLGKKLEERRYETWRSKLHELLTAKGHPEPLWDDTATIDYVTDRPGWEGRIGLALKYAHLLHPEFPEPTVPPCSIGFENDPAYLAGTQELSYLMILAEGTIWLPGTFKFALPIPLVSGPKLFVSSIAALTIALDHVCFLWGKDRDELIQTTYDQPGLDASLDEAAEYGLSVFCRMADEATRRNLPMIVDA